MNFTDLTRIKEHVANGFNWLTDFYGDTSWVWRIDLNKLDMAAFNACIGGQLEGEWQDAREKYGLTLEESKRLGLWTDEFYTYDGLDKEWTKIIIAERIRLQKAVGDMNTEKHAITVSVEVMLTAEQIGRIYLESCERGITVEEYVANEVGYAADRIQY